MPSRLSVHPVLLVLLGVAVALASGGGLWRSSGVQTQASWPSVEGEVVHSGVDARAPQVRQAVWPFSLWRPSPGDAYRPVVRYRYAVDDVPYLSARIGSGAPARGPREVAEVVAARFPVGARVRVSYDPDAPGTAVLVPSRGASPWALGGGVMGLIVGLGCLGAGLRSLRQRPLARESA